MKLHLLDLPADRMEGDVVVAFFFADERPLRGAAALLDWRLNGLLTDRLVRREAIGHAGEHLLLPSNGKIAASRVLFAGGGSWDGLSSETYAGLIRQALEVCAKAAFTNVALCLSVLPGMTPAAMAEMIRPILAGMAQKMNCQLSLNGAAKGRSQARRS